MFSKVLIANRGEIAVRINRALHEMGIATVAVHSEIDADALHVQVADEHVCIGGNAVSESYLNIERVVGAAVATGADAIHPGYGLLAENPLLVDACEAAGITFIGPDASALRQMGSKIEARSLMEQAGVPIVPGVWKAVTDSDEVLAIANEIGFPIVVKASGGGGGRGMRVARTATEVQQAFEGAVSEGERFFGDPSVYVEKYLDDPRHIEIQIVGDKFGNIVHLFERDCSVQRRHQKLIEESPAPILTVEERTAIGEIAIRAARAVNYHSLGTVEGLFQDGKFYFLEMNTRIQVEHGVTEMVTGIDLVKEQIRVAAGEPLSFDQDGVQVRGHAIECRINAEDAAKSFLPQPGRITRWIEPEADGVRVDSGVSTGAEVTPYYDPLLAKLIAWAPTRAEATARMLQALEDMEIEGVTTLLAFHQRLLSSEEWASSETCRNLIENKQWLRATDRAPNLARA